MNINQFVDKKYEKMTFNEIAKAPVDAIQGINERSAKLLFEAFKIRTVADLAKNKYFKWAQAICVCAQGEDQK